MRKVILLGLVFAFLLLSGTASAASISFYRRDANIDLENVTLEDTMIFNEAPGVLEMPLFFNVEELEARSTLPEHSCSVEGRDYGSLIRCQLSEGESGRLTLVFDAPGLVREVDRHYYFTDGLNVPYDTETLIYRADLREGLVLIEDAMDTPFRRFSPGHGEEGSDGRRIYIVWSDEDVSQGDGISPSVSFERTEEPPGEPLTDLYIALLGVALISAFLIVALRMDSGEETIPEALKEDERKVMEIVENAGGEIKQKKIVDKVDFSKAKVSRMIHDLKERGLLETKKVGRTNRVRLKERD